MHEKNKNTTTSRPDGRQWDELRPITAQVGLLHNAEGSALFKMGNTTAIAGVYGPRQVFPKHEELKDTMLLRTKYTMAPFSTSTRNRPGTSRRSTEISMVIQQALMPVIFLQEFPKTVVDLHIEVLQADASTRCAALNAAVLALADAGVPMRDLVAACSAGKCNGNMILDVAGKEDTEGDLDLPIAYYPKKKQVTLLQMDGITDADELKQIIKLAIQGCEQVYQAQQEALRSKYRTEETTEEEL
ncbi:MAG: exosome complex exonuclease Rrp41 [Candidatus Aenigmarchaeota archaeon]|nr:exosome complex exonuclease Rrp41 [Candidatus Aenigmarchaeota archaeon]